MARVSSSTRLRPISRSLAEYHSARVCAPPPSPPAPMDKAGMPSESGILASVEPRRRSVRRPKMAVHGAQSVEQRGIAGQLRGGAVADLVDGEGQESPAVRGDGFFAAALERSTASSTARCKATSRRSSCSGLVERKSMEAWALSGMEFTLVPPWMVPRFRVVRGSFRQAGLSQAGQGRSQRGDGVGRACIGKAVAAGADDGDLVAAAAQGLGDGRVRAGAIQNDVGGDAAGQRTLAVKMAHAAQIAFALFAHIAQKDERRGQFNPGLDQRVGDGQHAGNPGAVVAGARSFQAVAVHHRD